MAHVLDSYSIVQGVQPMGSSFTHKGRGQCITIGSMFSLQQIKFWLQKVGSPTGNMSFIMSNVTGTVGSTAVPNTNLAVKNIDASNVPTTGAWFSAALNGDEDRNTVWSSGNYCFAMQHAAGTSDASNYIAVGYDGTTVSHGGNAVIRSVSAGNIWVTDAATDTPFIVVAGETSDPVSLVQSVSSNATGTSAGFTLGSSVTAGNFIVFGVTGQGMVSITGVSDNLGNTYKVVDANWGSGGTADHRLYYCNTITSGSLTFTVTTNISAVIACVGREYANFPFASLLQEVNTNGTSTSPNGGTVLVNDNDCLIISTVSFPGSVSTLLPGSGYASSIQTTNSTGNKIGMESRPGAGAVNNTFPGSYAGGFLMSGSAFWTSGVAAFVRNRPSKFMPFFM